MTDKLELKSCHEVIYTVDVANIESIFHGKPIDPDILTVVMKDGKRLYCDEVCPVDFLQEELVSGLDNKDMPIERWKQAVAAAANQRNYRSSKGLTETRDDYFVDGVQWADEHHKEEPVSEDLEEAIGKSFIYHENHGDDFRSDEQIETAYRYGFKFGAQWKKKQLIEKACEYLEPNVKIILCGDKRDTDKFIDGLKKYMEKELWYI